jgi:hypothetical protein
MYVNSTSRYTLAFNISAYALDKRYNVQVCSLVCCSLYTKLNYDSRLTSAFIVSCEDLILKYDATHTAANPLHFS